MSSATTDIALDLPRLSSAYTDGALSPSHVAETILDTIAARGDDGVWIARTGRDALFSRTRELEALSATERAARPLWGVPVSVKDCIDVAGLPTTSACPGYSYVPTQHSPAVARLLAAGAILIGKTNMDQFATGLVGVRSPYGVARNPFDAAYIPGGSSSGAAVSVAAGLVSLALGTDTGGSGRVPAALNNVVGLKPTRGLVSGVGTVPACRSIETISVFALTTADAEAGFDAIRAYDRHDPFARPLTLRDAEAWPIFRFGVPAAPWLEFFGDTAAAALFDASIARLEAIGGVRVEIDFAPFREINDMLFLGPWLAERYGALKPILDRDIDAVLPVTRDILRGGADITGAQVFAGQQRLAVLKQTIDAQWRDIDVLVVPTTPTTYKISELDADPITLNARMGTYTTFVNLADLAAVAVPAGFLPNGLPQGVSLIGPALSDRSLARLAERFHRHAGLPLGARDHGGAAPDFRQRHHQQGVCDVITAERFLGQIKRLSRTAMVLGAAFAASATSLRAEDVTIGAGLSMGWGQFFVADQAKTWDKQGLTPKTTIFASGRLALDALVGGGVVVATAAETPVVFANLNGLPVRIIATLNRQESFDLVAIKDIKTAKDIKGRKIGYSQGTNAHYYLSKLLKEANLTFADITAVSLNPGDFVTSLSNGAIDGFIWTEPHISLALKQGGDKFHAVRSPGLYVGFSTVIALQSTIDKNPDLLVKVVKSLIDANDLIKKDPNAAAGLIAERIKVDPEIVRNFLPRTRFNIDLERADLVAELQTQAKWAIDNKLVRPDAKVPDFNTVVVGSILDKAREK